jgi:undecaprenyl-diphosphatase
VSHAATLRARLLGREGGRTAVAALAVAAVCTMLFGELSESLPEAELRDADERVAASLRHHAAASLTALAHASSLAGSAHVLAAVGLTAGVSLLARRRVLDSALVALALVGAELINAALKNLFERPRPSMSDPLATAGGFSFPSGHAMASTALLATLALVVTRGRPAQTRLAAFGMAAALVGAIGLSRVYLGVHYPTDVAAGWSAGLAWASVSVLLLSLVRVYRSSSRGDPP